MNKLKFIFSILFLSLVNLLLSQNDNFSLHGKVLDSNDKIPLYGVYISFGETTAITNSEGEFTIKDISKGKYKLTAKHYSYFKEYSKDIYIDKDSSIIILLEDNSFLLDEVVITGTRIERPLSKTPILTKLIRDKEIMKAGSTSILESMQDNIPGLLTSPNPMGNNLRFKGLNSRYILFLVDGERLVSESAGGNINFDQIDVNEIKRIEIIDGASSALYGSNAIGGVINIITKQASDKNKIESSVEANATSKKSYTGKASISSKYKKISTRANVSRTYSPGFTIPTSTFTAVPYLDHLAGLKFNYFALDNLNFNLSGRYFRHELFNSEFNGQTIGLYTHYLNQNYSSILSSNYNTRDKKYFLNLSVNYNKHTRHTVYEILDIDNKRDNELDNITVRTLNTYKPNEKLELLLGLEHNLESNYSDELLGSVPTKKSINESSLFGQANYKIIPDLEIGFGARETYNSAFKSSFNPKISTMYQVSKFKFRAGVGTAFRSPSIKELYYDFDHLGMFWIYGNTKLKPENGIYYSLSSEYTNNTINTYLSGYHNKIDNKIVQYDSIDNVGKLGKYYTNTESASLTGFDIGINYTPISQLVLKANYSFCHAIDNKLKAELLGNIKHSSTVSITWNGSIYKSPYSILFSGRISSPNKFESFASGKVENIDKIYNIWKLVFTKPFKIKNNSLDLSFKIDNIFNFTDEYFIDPGRLFYLSIRYNYK